MNSVQESKNELEASIRYAENAISSAKQTIESMEFRQEMAQKNYAEQTGREEALAKQVQELEEARGRAEGEVELLQGAVRELESKVQGQYSIGAVFMDRMQEYTELQETPDFDVQQHLMELYEDLSNLYNDNKNEL